MSSLAGIFIQYTGIMSCFVPCISVRLYNHSLGNKSHNKDYGLLTVMFNFSNDGIHAYSKSGSVESRKYNSLGCNVNTANFSI